MTTATATMQPTSLWADLKTTVNSIFGAIVAIARTTEKTVNLAELEVDNLSQMQHIRLDATMQERAEQQATFTKQLASVKRATNKANKAANK
ncbi:unnamed protein product [marine sediment metagenome]|uniref:Uncharacterized protein n=1 Tax=marine sediment metagenome TaxID=412755 RepID=X0T3N1_9ZZZZ